MDHAISPLWAAPFITLLLAIAVIPLINHRWWERWYALVAIGLGGIVAMYYALWAPSAAPWLGGMEEYLSFIVLLASLYMVSGGIVIHVNRKATPLMNVALLLSGAILANVLGTTGASMVLIRPYLRMNRGHIRPYHVVFFIFLVSNVGGLLTPIGDPPLFLGYLNGVPFWWVLERCHWAWLMVVGLLLAQFWVIDRIDHGKSERHTPDGDGAAVAIMGWHNLLFIAVIVLGVFQTGLFEAWHHLRHDGITAGSLARLALCREWMMILAAGCSRLATGKSIYQRNQFTYAPIREVAILFLGIFSAMAPALQWLGDNAAGLTLHTPGQYYFVTGALSSFLDNAPTYLTMLQTELASLPQPKVSLLIGDPARSLCLVAISMGAVFFGAGTYIGNGPNFMVKSIAVAAGVRMPSFAGYILRYALPILAPVYLLVWLVFL